MGSYGYSSDLGDAPGFGGVEYTLFDKVQAIEASRFTIFAEVMCRSVDLVILNTAFAKQYRLDGASLSGAGVNLGLKLRW